MSSGNSIDGNEEVTLPDSGLPCWSIGQHAINVEKILSTDMKTDSTIDNKITFRRRRGGLCINPVRQYAKQHDHKNQKKYCYFHRW